MKEKYEKIGKPIYTFISVAIMIVFALLILYLFVNSIMSTSHIYVTKDRVEQTSYISDNFLIHIVFILASIFLFYQCKKRNITVPQKAIDIITKVVFAVIIVFILSTQVKASYDQKYIFDVAAHMKVNDYSDYAPGGYMNLYPNQNGIVLIIYFLSFIFGDNNYMADYIINAICLMVIFTYTKKLATKITDDINVERVTYIGAILFIPMALYSSWAYGTVPGMALALMGFYHGINFVKEGKVQQMLIAIVCLSLAAMVKNNYLIMLVAYICYVIIAFIKKPNTIKGLAIITTICAYVFFSSFVSLLIEQMTGYEESKGIPKKCWVVMGLSDNEALAPGWYNGYGPARYKENGYDYDKTDEVADKALKERIDYFVENPKEALDFFHRKTLSQWNNPTFQGMWIYQVRPSLIERSKITESVIKGKIEKIINGSLNIYQSLILFGTLLYSALYLKKKTVASLIIPISFIGGFVFHMFWEGKAQYTMTYFYMLIPLAVAGYYCLAEKVLTFKKSDKNE